ncbi:hypothetical protein GE09DRAFT_244214 [Coniochaeta sp. 2T2.1]|nr:hypothetical protein GE09DRAFT_244214 [Coniochaeta sp. 2T2.1]
MMYWSCYASILRVSFTWGLECGWLSPLTSQLSDYIPYSYALGLSVDAETSSTNHSNEFKVHGDMVQWLIRLAFSGFDLLSSCPQLTIPASTPNNSCWAMWAVSTTE